MGLGADRPSPEAWRVAAGSTQASGRKGPCPPAPVLSPMLGAALAHSRSPAEISGLNARRAASHALWQTVVIVVCGVTLQKDNSKSFSFSLAWTVN